MSRLPLPTTTLLVLLALAGCEGDKPKGSADSASCSASPSADVDGDGHLPIGEPDNCEDNGPADDCDDDDEAVYPGAEEVPYNGKDDDCDGGDLTDVDGDGHGAISAGGDDPDDTDASTYPGSLDDDNDGDGYSENQGDTNDTDATETPDNDDDGDGDGYTPSDGDCDDANATAHPGAWEQCNDIDDDCDGTVDEDTEERFIHADVDEDGYGSETDGILACALSSGFVDDNTDCDDAEIAINPAADELCNGVDDDCDGLVDDDDPDPKLDWSVWYYPDRDGDGSVDASDPDFTYAQLCDEPNAYASMTGDCDDANPLVYPGASEVCDGVRNDCAISSADWTANAEALEAGLVSYIAEDGGLIDDYGGVLPTTSGPPVTLTLEENGALNFCADPAGTTWYVAIEADNVSVDITGLRGSSVTVLSGEGAGRPIAVTNATAEVSGLTLSDGFASAGGGLFASYTDLTLSDVVLQDNDANGGNQRGAALTIEVSQASLTDVVITGSASSYGLGCYSSTLLATRLTVEVNDHTGVLLYACSTALANTQIANNVEDGFIIQQYGTTTIHDSSIDHNARGIYLANPGTVTIEGSSIYDNGNATSGGAGIYAYSTGDITLTDTTLESNHGEYGGAIYLNYGANLSMSGTTDCAVQDNVANYANAAFFGSEWTGTLSSSGCDWDAGQDIYYASTTSTEDVSTLADPLNFTCTPSGCY